MAQRVEPLGEGDAGYKYLFFFWISAFAGMTDLKGGVIETKMLTLLIFIIILGLLVFVHEFGHFLASWRVAWSNSHE